MEDSSHRLLSLRMEHESRSPIASRVVLYLAVMSANGTDVRVLTDAIDVRGSFSWSPDGQWIVFAGPSAAESTRIYKVSASGGSLTRLTKGISSRPLWSPDGRFIVYSEPVQGARMQVKGMTPDGKPYPLPVILGQLSNGESVSFRTRHKCLDLPEGSGCSQSELLLGRPGQRAGASDHRVSIRV